MLLCKFLAIIKNLYVCKCDFGLELFVFLLAGVIFITLSQYWFAFSAFEYFIRNLVLSNYQNTPRPHLQIVHTSSILSVNPVLFCNIVLNFLQTHTL